MSRYESFQRVEARWPYRGRCCVCGDPDDRHRLFDAMRDRRLAGESVESIADDYEIEPALVLDVLALDVRFEEAP